MNTWVASPYLVYALLAGSKMFLEAHIFIYSFKDEGSRMESARINACWLLIHHPVSSLHSRNTKMQVSFKIPIMALREQNSLGKCMLSICAQSWDGSPAQRAKWTNMQIDGLQHCSLPVSWMWFVSITLEYILGFCLAFGHLCICLGIPSQPKLQTGSCDIRWVSLKSIGYNVIPWHK